MDDQRKTVINFLDTSSEVTRSTLHDFGAIIRETMAEFGVSEPSSSGSGFGVRHLQVLLTFTFLAVHVFLQVNMSIAIISMTSSKDTSPGYPVYDWDEEDQDTILSSFFWGYLLMQIIAGNLAEKHGAKMIMAGGVIVSSVANSVLPYVANKGGVIAVCGLRAFQGAVQGIFFPCVGAVLSKWIPPVERSTAVPVAYSGSLFGTILVFPLSGYLATTPLGWPSIFYVTSIVGFVWTIVWLLVGASSPSDHSFISEDERQYIETSLHYVPSKEKKTPWKEIWTSVPVWALITAHTGQNWGFWTLVTQMPKYINSVLGINIRDDGILSALPFISSWVMVLVFSWISRVLQNHGFMSKTGRIKMWNSIAMWGSSLVLLIQGLTCPMHSALIIALFVLTMGLNAGVNSGIFANHVELSPNFGGTLVGITNTIANLSSIFAPLTVGWIVHIPTSAKDWSPVFILASAIMFVTNLIYVLFGSAKLQKWNDPETDENSAQKTNTQDK